MNRNPDPTFAPNQRG